jgi:hypothetical protein
MNDSPDSRVEAYRREAQRARDTAANARSEEAGDRWLTVAADWDKLADDIERNTFIRSKP